MTPMQPTRVSVLAAVAAIATVMGVAVADLVDTQLGRSIPIPWSAVLTIAAVAVALAGWALSFRRRLRASGTEVDPFVAVRSAALAMAASRAGAITAGLFAGIGLWFAADLSTPVARERAVVCAAGVVASLALVAAALWLEHICRIPEDPEGGEPAAAVEPADGGDWVHPRASAPPPRSTPRR